MTGRTQEDTGPGTGLGEAMLARALAGSWGAWGGRFVAAYALGSLAHGGFSEHVSDVDFGVVISDPLEGADAAKAEAIAARLKASGAPLADRVSVFWGSPATLGGKAQGGRFPPVDLVDLKQHGRLLAGKDVREAVRGPSEAELVVAAARHALARSGSHESVAQTREPGDASVRDKAARGLMPVTRLFVEEYEARLRALGEVELADAFAQWRERLERGES